MYEGYPAIRAAHDDHKFLSSYVQLARLHTMTLEYEESGIFGLGRLLWLKSVVSFFRSPFLVLNYSKSRLPAPQLLCFNGHFVSFSPPDR